MAKGTASRAFVWVILALLIVGLAGFGATNFGGSVRSVTTVGDIEISVDDYGRELQQDLRELAAQSVTRNQALPWRKRALGLDRAALSQLVWQAALDHETARIGLSVGDETVRARKSRKARRFAVFGRIVRPRSLCFYTGKYRADSGRIRRTRSRRDRPEHPSRAL